MYKLVIVDDERDVRDRLVSLVAKAGGAFELVAQYENGIDAYEGILSDNPDLIITDIRIPYIDGIELARKLREVLPLLKIIIITGYDEFDYAKEAANLGVVGFISKPITQDDIQAILEKAKRTLDNEFVTAANLSQLNAFYNQSLPVIRETDLLRLSGLSQVPPAFERKLRFNGVNLDYRYMAFCVFDFDQTIHDTDAEKYELAYSSIRKFIAEDIAALYDLDMFNRYEKLCLLTKSNLPFDRVALESCLAQVILRVGRYSGMPLSVGVSGFAEQERNFAKMLREAQRALRYRAVMGGRKVFFYDSSAPIRPGQVIEDNDIKELGYLLRYKSTDEFLAALRRLRAQLTDGEALNATYHVLTTLMNVLIKACDDLERLCERYEGQDAMYRRIFEAKTADEAFGFLEELGAAVRACNDGVIVDNVARNLQQVINYMEAHYCDPDISFVSMADEINFSVSYVSALLKKNLDTTFVKLLTGMRMEKARELLRSPALKIIDVAEQLGYADPYYFSHCFKKYTGMSPKEYRSYE